MLYTDPKSALMDHAEENGGRTLEVQAVSTRAIRFYEKRGWHSIRKFEGDEFGTMLETIEMSLHERS